MPLRRQNRDVAVEARITYAVLRLSQVPVSKPLASRTIAPMRR